MPSALKLEDDGFLELSIGGVTKQIDLWSFYNSMLEARQQVSDEDLPICEFHARIVKLLEDLGFAGCSHKIANKVATEIQGIVEQKKRPRIHQPRPPLSLLRSRNLRRPKRPKAQAALLHVRRESGRVSARGRHQPHEPRSVPGTGSCGNGIRPCGPKANHKMACGQDGRRTQDSLITTRSQLAR